MSYFRLVNTVPLCGFKQLFPGCIALLITLGCTQLSEPPAAGGLGSGSVTVQGAPAEASSDKITLEWCVTDGLSEAIWVFSLGYSEEPNADRKSWVRFEPTSDERWVTVVSKSSRVLGKGGPDPQPGAFHSQNLAQRVGSGEQLCGGVDVPTYAGVEAHRVAGGAAGRVVGWKDPWDSSGQRPRFVPVAGMECAIEVGYVTDAVALTAAEPPIPSGAGYMIGAPNFPMAQTLVRSATFGCGPRGDVGLPGK